MFFFLLSCSLEPSCHRLQLFWFCNSQEMSRAVWTPKNQSKRHRNTTTKSLGLCMKYCHSTQCKYFFPNIVISIFDFFFEEEQNLISIPVECLFWLLVLYFVELSIQGLPCLINSKVGHPCITGHHLLYKIPAQLHRLFLFCFFFNTKIFCLLSATILEP